MPKKRQKQPKRKPKQSPKAKKTTMPNEPSKAIQPTEIQPTQLITGKDSIRQGAKIATELMKLVDEKNLAIVIDGKQYLPADVWATLGAMLGVFPEVTRLERQPEKTFRRMLVEYEYYNRQTKAKGKAQKFIPPAGYDPSRHTIIKDYEGNDVREFDEMKYLAEVLLKTSQGSEISKAQAICSNAEANRLGNEEYAIASMAQTRATGKAFRLAFSWIVKLAGYEPTPAEEVVIDQENGNGNGNNASQTPKVENQLKLK